MQFPHVFHEEEINAEEEEKGLRKKEEIEYPKQIKNNVGNNIILY
jgi:hypothetical protein